MEERVWRLVSHCKGLHWILLWMSWEPLKGLEPMRDTTCAFKKTDHSGSWVESRWLGWRCRRLVGRLCQSSRWRMMVTWTMAAVTVWWEILRRVLYFECQAEVIGYESKCGVWLKERGAKDDSSVFDLSYQREELLLTELGNNRDGSSAPLGWERIIVTGLVPSSTSLPLGNLSPAVAPEAPASDRCLLQYPSMCCPFPGMSSCLSNSAGRKIRFYPISSS